MNRTIPPWVIAALSFAFTYLFFLEYLPPFERVHIPYDLEGFHYPLADYAFQAVRHGRFPAWDPTNYCGLSFAGNSQAALFYPPTWLMFAANIGRPSLAYLSLQVLVFLHVWLAFFLCYVWLRHKKLAELACILGAGVFAYSGYMLNQLQHLGLVGGFAWFPLALWGIDQAIEEHQWRHLWKVVLASALCFLAGYPPTWFVFAVCMVSYAAWRWRVAFGVVLALGASLLIAAVQLLPARDATAMKVFEPRYSGGFRNPEAYVSYLLPNYFDFGMHHRPTQHWAGDYLYLGAPAFLGLVLLARRKKWLDVLPALSILVASLVGATNPFGLVWAVVRHSNLLAQICRDWYFLAGLTLAAAPLAAFGLDYCLKQARRPVPRWFTLMTIGLLTGWSARQMLVWFPIGSDFPSGWRSAIEPAVTLILFSLAIFILPAQHGLFRIGLIAALLLTVAVDYKVFGTSKWPNASESLIRDNFASFPEIDDAIYKQLRLNIEYRNALDLLGPFPPDLRHYGLTTPQGYDPFLPAQYQKLMTEIAHFRTNWLIDIDPANEAALRLLGVRYFISAEVAPLYRQLSKNPDFRLLEPSLTYYKVFEFAKAKPPYGWVLEGSNGSVRRIRWEPEAREFDVRSEAGGRFELAEQYFPGWQATVDGKPALIERWSEAFQAVQVAPGEHRVAFRFRSFGLRVGAVLSFVGILGLGVVIWWPAGSRH